MRTSGVLRRTFVRTARGNQQFVSEGKCGALLLVEEIEWCFALLQSRKLHVGHADGFGNDKMLRPNLCSIAALRDAKDNQFSQSGIKVCFSQECQDQSQKLGANRWLMRQHSERL